MERKLYRRRHDRMISGVCAGIADYFEIDPTFVRLAAVVLAIASFGTVAIAYIVMIIVVPEEPAGSVHDIARGAETYGATAPAYAPPVPPPMPPSLAAATEQPATGTRGRGGVWFGVILVVLGLVLLLGQFVPGVNLWQLWPLILVVVGILTIFRRGGTD